MLLIIRGGWGVEGVGVGEVLGGGSCVVGEDGIEK